MSIQAKNLVRSIQSSQVKPISAAVKGELPKWLKGTLYRNGSGQFRFGNKSYKHLFDGMAVVNKFQINDGKVIYSNKILETNMYKRTRDTGFLYPMFGTTDPCSKLFDRFKLFFKNENDNVNVNIVPFSDNQLYALTESSMVARIDPNSLDVMNTNKITRYLKQTLSVIAHPHIDETDGGWISLGRQPRGKELSYDFIKFQNIKGSNASNICENAKLLARVPSSQKNRLSYFHSFGLTKNYIVFLEQSLVLDMKRVLPNLVLNRPIKKAFIMDRNFKTKIHLINRHTGQILPTNYYTDPLFTFHHTNAYETDNQIIVDLQAYDAKTFDISHFDYNEEDASDIILKKVNAYARRITIPFDSANKSSTTPVYCEIKDQESKYCFELGTINYMRYNTKDYKYAYGLDLTKDPRYIVKINAKEPNQTKVVEISDPKQELVPTEPVFVEKPNAVDEDDGVLLSVVIGQQNDYLLVLDAKTMQEIARADLPSEVKATFTFHGFFADTQNFKYN